MLRVGAAVFATHAMTVSDEAWLFYSVDNLLHNWSDPNGHEAVKREPAYIQYVIRQREADRRPPDGSDDHDHDLDELANGGAAAKRRRPRATHRGVGDGSVGGARDYFRRQQQTRASKPHVVPVRDASSQPQEDDGSD